METWESITKTNPIISMLNHLYDMEYIEINKAKTTDEKILETAEKILKTKEVIDFLKCDQENTFISIRRKGIVVSEQFIAHKEKLVLQKSRAEQEKKQAESEALQAKSAQDLEHIVGVFGVMAVIVAVLDWDWENTITIVMIFRILVMVALLFLTYIVVKKLKRR